MRERTQKIYEPDLSVFFAVAMYAGGDGIHAKLRAPDPLAPAEEILAPTR